MQLWQLYARVWVSVYLCVPAVVLVMRARARIPSGNPLKFHLKAFSFRILIPLLRRRSAHPSLKTDPVLWSWFYCSIYKYNICGYACVCVCVCNFLFKYYFFCCHRFDGCRLCQCFRLLSPLHRLLRPRQRLSARICCRYAGIQHFRNSNSVIFPLWYFHTSRAAHTHIQTGINIQMLRAHNFKVFYLHSHAVMCSIFLFYCNNCAK